MVVDVVKYTQDLIKEARKGYASISPGQIVLQRGGRGGNWFFCRRITRTEAMKLLLEKAQGNELMKDLLEQVREGSVFLTPISILLQPKGRGNKWFSGILISRTYAMELLKARAREIKKNLKAQNNGA